MPTEVFEIADSQDIEFNEGTTGARLKTTFGDEYPNTIIDAVKAGLIAAGWDLIGSTKPTIAITMPYGIVTAIEPDTYDPPTVEATGERMLTVQTIDFYVYNPYANLPGIAPGVWIPAAETIAATMDALHSAIEANTAWAVIDYVVTPAGSHNFTLEGTVEGTQYNDVAIGGEGYANGRKFWSVQGEAERGGWMLRTTRIDGTYLEVWIYAQSRQVYFEFRNSAGGEQPAFSIRPGIYSSGVFGGAGEDFCLVANQFQFAVFRDQTPADTIDFIFASLMHKEHGCEHAIMIIGSGSGQRGLLSWPYSSAGARDGGLHTTVPDAVYTAGPKVYAFRGASETSQGFNLITSAWVSIPSNTGDARIVGKLWDALVLSRAPDLDDRMVFRELVWQCIARNSTFGGTPASLWLAYDDAPAA